MNFREQRQQEFANVWLKHKFGILHLSPRFGKCYCTIKILEKLNNPKTLIVYPLDTIKISWKNEFEKWKYNSDNIEYCTNTSLWKISEIHKLYDLIVIDEIHTLSPANLLELKQLIEFGNNKVLGLSGTISEETEKELFSKLKLPILAQYPIEQGIKERVITDYEIYVVVTRLDDRVKHVQPFKSKPKYKITEQNAYEQLSEKISDKLLEGRDPGLLPILRANIFKKSIAKFSTTKQLISRFKDERLLIFCGLTEIADKLGVPSYHSKNKNEVLKNNFCSGLGDVLATVDMFEAGVTVKPINRAIINSFDSNPENLAQRISRLTGFEYDNPGKVAKVYIVATNTKTEERWLNKALEFFDPSKVKYVTL